MRIQLNGEDRDIDAASTRGAALLKELGLDRGGIAVEVNRAIVPKSTHEEHRFQEDDRVEIVTIMGGG